MKVHLFKPEVKLEIQAPNGQEGMSRSCTKQKTMASFEQVKESNESW